MRTERNGIGTQRARRMTVAAVLMLLAQTGLPAELRVGPGELYATIASALADANPGGGDTILITTNVLTEANVTISKSVTIAGQGMTNTVVQAATSRSNTVGGVSVGRIFTVTTSGLQVGIRDLTLRYGYTNAGGAISVSAGGSWNLQVANCVLAENDATGGGGGAISAFGNSTFTLTVSNCLFRQNAASGSGGAILYGRYGATAVAQTTLIDGCTFAGNQGNGGGAIASDLTSAISSNGVRNCTFIRNASSAGGGALGLYGGSNFVFHATIVSNTASSGGGIRIEGGAMNVHNSIVYGNSAGLGAALHRQGGTFVATNSLVQGSIQGAVTTNGCLINQDPQVLPLAANGGATPTCALRTGSPCIDTGLSATGYAFDQRGPGYPRSVGAAADMGAVEYGAGTTGLVYLSTVFNEWYADDGTINNDNPMLIELLNTSFASTNGEDLVASGKLAVANQSPGTFVFVARQVNSNLLSVTVNGAATPPHGSAQNVTNLTFAFANGAFTLGNTNLIAGSTRSDLQIQYLDATVNPVLTWTGTRFVEASANDGAIAAAPNVTVALVNDHFAGTNGQDFVALNWVTVTNLPTSLTAVVARVSDFQASLALTGKKDLPHNASNSVSNLGLQFLDAAFYSAASAAIVTNSTSPALTIAFTNPAVAYSATTFTESEFNDGSLWNTLTLTLAGDTLTGANGDDFLAANKAAVSNVPTGLTASLKRASATTLTAALLGKAVAHAPANNTNNLAIVFQDSAFTYTPAAVVTNYAATNLAVSFYAAASNYYVTVDGSDTAAGTNWPSALKTITNALAKCRQNNGDTVNLGPGDFTQPNVTINNKSVQIRGQGVDQTFWQAASTYSSGVGRILYMGDDNSYTRCLTVSNLTMRYGSTNANGGAFSCYRYGDARFVNCAFVSNAVGPAAADGGAFIFSDGNNYRITASFSNCTFLGNTCGQDAGAVRIGSAARVFFHGSTLRDNTAARNGGAVWGANGPFTANNSTFWGNRAGGLGGALGCHAGVDYINHCTIVSNVATGTGGGGIARDYNQDSLTVYNSIVGSNVAAAGTAYYSSAGTLALSNCVVYGTTQGGSMVNCLTGQDPKVSPPADNGGPTPTCALQAGSPCIGAANPATALSTDQRGYPRDVAPDMGAFEYGAGPASTTSGSLFILR